MLNKIDDNEYIPLTETATVGGPRLSLQHAPECFWSIDSVWGSLYNPVC